jgi:phage repressor protein C with HTH and peptisase S24 domain
MKPDRTWIKDWRIGKSPSAEGVVAQELLDLFSSFWEETGLEAKAITTQRKYSGALHALGGHILEKAVSEQEPAPVRDLVPEAIESGYGPLIFPENPTWQDELDTVCRKLYRYLAHQC